MTGKGGGWKLILEGFGRENHVFKNISLQYNLSKHYDSVILPLFFFLLLSSTGITYHFYYVKRCGLESFQRLATNVKFQFRT